MMKTNKDIRFCWLPTNELSYGENIEIQDTSIPFYQKLLKSVRDNGVIEPLLVINPRHVKIGNSRLWAAKQCKIVELPCIVVTLERDIGKIPIPDGRVVENIYDEFKMPIHWVERRNYIAMKCTHTHLGHKEVV